MGFANNVIPGFIANDPQKMQSLAAYLMGTEAESSVRLDGETCPVETNPRAWMFDIDGTLTEWNSGEDPQTRGWFDYDRLEEDRPNPATIELAWMIRRAEIPLIFITARPERWAEQTLRWLDRHYLVTKNSANDEVNLFMRPDDDMETPDQVVKRALYTSLVRPNWTVLGVFEDNDRCVNTWLNEGLSVFQPHHRKDSK